MVLSNVEVSSHTRLFKFRLIEMKSYLKFSSSFALSHILSACRHIWLMAAILNTEIQKISIVLESSVGQGR